MLARKDRDISQEFPYSDTLDIFLLNACYRLNLDRGVRGKFIDGDPIQLQINIVKSAAINSLLCESNPQ